MQKPFDLCVYHR